MVLYHTLFSMGLASINIGLNQDEINLSPNVEISIVPKEISPSLYPQQKFSLNQKNSIGTGYNRNKVLLKFALLNSTDQTLQRKLYFNTINGHLHLYKIEKDQINLLTEGGTSVPFNKRSNPDSFSSLSVELPPKSENTYIISLVSRHNINAKLMINTEEEIKKVDTLKKEFLNFYAGGMFLLIIYNFFIFTFLRDKTYAYYCLYALSFTLTALLIQCRLDQIIPLSSFSFAHYLICFSSLTMFSANLFTYYFLEIEKHLPKLKNIFYLVMLSNIMTFIMGITNITDIWPDVFGYLIDLTILFALIIYISLSIVLLKKTPMAKFYLFSWGVVLISVSIWFGMTFNFLPLTNLSLYILPMGNMLEMLTLSLALAYRIVILNKEKVLALSKAKDRDKYERLVRVLSHDVANSLTVVNSYSKKLTNNSSILPEHKKQIEKIYIASENIKNILKIVREQDILVSQQNNGLKLIPVNILECAQATITLHEESLAQKNLKINLNLDPDTIILADKTCFINNIFSNILSNAIKFSFPDGNIDIFTTDSDDFINLIIKDYGIGIQDNLINDIFFTEKFITSKGTNQESGSGIGSNLIREYMLLFNGNLQVQSITQASNSLNHGTTIRLIFPKIHQNNYNI